MLSSLVIVLRPFRALSTVWVMLRFSHVPCAYLQSFSFERVQVMLLQAIPQRSPRNEGIAFPILRPCRHTVLG